MINTNSVLDPTTGYQLELRQLLKTPESKLCRDVALYELSLLAQVIKKVTIKGTNTIHFISPKLKLTSKKQPMLKLSSATDHKKKTHIEFGSLLELNIYIYWWNL